MPRTCALDGCDIEFELTAHNRKYCSETHRIEAQIKDQIWQRMRERLGDVYLAEHADFLDAQWEWAKELRMVDEETDLIAGE